MDQVKPQKPIVVGLVVNQTQAQDQAQTQAPVHLANPLEKIHSEAVINSDTNGLNERMFCVQGTNGSSETSKELGAAEEAPMVVLATPMRAKLHSCSVAELSALISVASHLDREVERQIGDDPRNTVDSNSPGQLEVMDKGLHSAVLSSENTSVSGDPFHRHQWEVSFLP